jgi:hypothetical protein
MPESVTPFLSNHIGIMTSTQFITGDVNLDHLDKVVPPDCSTVKFLLFLSCTFRKKCLLFVLYSSEVRG